MKKVSRILTLGALAAFALALPSPVGATCIPSVPVQHALGSFLASCPDEQPVDGYLYTLGNEALNSNSTTAAAGADQKIDFACEATGVQTEQGMECLPEAGSAGDGQVTISYDWGGINLSNPGCPNPTPAEGVGRQVVQVVANDGSSVILTLGWTPVLAQYAMESAHPGGGFSPATCSQTNGLTLVSNTAGLQANTVCVQHAAPPVYSDCDPDSGGAAGLASCVGGIATPVAAAPGNLFTRNGSCDATPDLRRAQWTPLPTNPGAGGSKCGVVTLPAAGQGQCAFIGASTFFNDGSTAATESAALTGWFRITPDAAANDKVAIRKAEFQQGKLRVDFGTENEATITGFNVYAGSSKLNTGVITAKGTGSNDYSFEVGRGALKNERSITIEALKSDGTSVRSSAVSVK